MTVVTGSEERRIISTGSVEIDKKMGGGIPEGSLILIEGQSNAGKSVITQQLLNGALNSGFRCILYTTENTPQSLFRQMASLDLDVTDFFLLGALNVYRAPGALDPDMAATIFDEILDHLATLEGRFDVSEYAVAMWRPPSGTPATRSKGAICGLRMLWRVSTSSCMIRTARANASG